MAVSDILNYSAGPNKKIKQLITAPVCHCHQMYLKLLSTTAQTSQSIFIHSNLAVLQDSFNHYHHYHYSFIIMMFYY